ncbi:hypothetical protein Gohar_026909, partial [Gossypium harknessii]|nr:hypothetical protein [Gossypium harknessii]
HPSIETVAKRFLNQNKPLNETTHVPVHAYHNVSINLLVQDFNDVHD